MKDLLTCASGLLPVDRPDRIHGDAAEWQLFQNSRDRLHRADMRPYLAPRASAAGHIRAFLDSLESSQVRDPMTRFSLSSEAATGGVEQRSGPDRSRKPFAKVLDLQCAAWSRTDCREVPERNATSDRVTISSTGDVAAHLTVQPDRLLADDDPGRIVEGHASETTLHARGHDPDQRFTP